MPRRHGGPGKPRPYSVDGRDYFVSISAGEKDEEGNVLLRITFRAQFGNRSACLVRGITNRSYWHDYPEIESMRAESVSITPKVACELIRLAHREGWDPVSSKADFEWWPASEAIRDICGNQAFSPEDHCE